jgi:hypothetical protein
MKLKREHPLEAATRELHDLIENILRDWPTRDRPLSDTGPPPRSGTWPTRQLKRLLNLANKRGANYAYTLILHHWLRKHEISIPPGIFSKNIVGPGTGPKQSKQKREDGEKAWRRQIELITEETKDLSEDELARSIWNAAPSYKASQIAKELFPRRYSGGLKKREAARKYVIEAIKLVKPSAKAFAERFLMATEYENLLDLLMGARPPYD